MDADISADLQSQVLAAKDGRETLFIRGYGSKEFYGRQVQATATLETAGHRGVLSYDPSELVITARGGTPLAEIQAVLAEAGQMLPFEPPCFAEESSIGGAVASGLSGPGRPWRGAVRDVLLGVTLLDGKGQILKFGGQVMKNVAGYDLSRLMAGSLGTLGVLLEVSVRLMPVAVEERTLTLEADERGFRDLVRQLRKQPVPLTGACAGDDKIYLRLSGHPSVLDQVKSAQGGTWMDDGDDFWTALRDHQSTFFENAERLWRLSLPPDTPSPALSGSRLLDWGGAQHWLASSAEETDVRDATKRAGGHAILFRGAVAEDDVFQPLDATTQGLHRRLKSVFDPQGVLNPGRMYADL